MVLVLVNFVTHAQNIAKDSILKVGFSKSIEELRDNAPSIPFDYEITEKEAIITIIPNRYTTVYNISINKEKTDSIGDVIGFSDGKDIYLKTINTEVFGSLKSNKFKEKSDFIKVKNIGIYLFYKDYYASHGPSGGFAFGETITNIKTGKIIVLSKYEMKKLLADAPDLLKEFNNDKNRKKNFEKYILEYNKRYRAKLQL